MNPRRKSLMVRSPLQQIHINDNLNKPRASIGQPKKQQQQKTAKKSKSAAPITPVKMEDHTAAAIPRLSNPQLSNLYTECIKLATANKINQKNTWSLQLIDYMQDVLKADGAEEEAGVKRTDNAYYKGAAEESRIKLMNFQRASCTLEASMMIYSHRVDSVHKDTFKVLDGLSRSDVADDADGMDADGDGNNPKPKRRKALTTTLETNKNNINVKGFDLESRADPLFQKTSANFDQGGAKGLLMNNLYTYDRCTIAFDSDISLEFGGVVDGFTPEELEEQQKEQERRDMQTAGETTMNLDLSELTNTLEKLCQHTPIESMEICPQLAEFNTLADEAEKAAEELERYGNESDSESDNEPEPCTQDLDDELNLGDGQFDGDLNDLDLAIQNEEKLFQEMQSAPPPLEIDPGVAGGDFPRALATVPMSPTFDNCTPRSDMNCSFDDDLEDAQDEGGFAVPLIFSEHKAELAVIDAEVLKNWAGASHWKFKAKRASAADRAPAAPRSRGKKQVFTIDFLDGTEADNSAFVIASSEKANCLTKATLAKLDAAKYLLPDDLGYNLKSLITLFTKPVLMPPGRNGKRRIKRANVQAPQGEDIMHNDDGVEGGLPDFGADFAGDFGGDAGHSDSDDDDSPGESGGFQLNLGQQEGDTAMGFDDMEMIAEPTKVEKLDIKYSKFAKKVDVKKLKESMWSNIQSSSSTPKPKKEADENVKEQPEPASDTNSFQGTMSALKEKIPDAAMKNISVPFCFICLLHLCNEKELKLVPKPNMDVNQDKYTPFDLGDFEIIKPDAK